MGLNGVSTVYRLFVILVVVFGELMLELLGPFNLFM